MNLWFGALIYTKTESHITPGMNTTSVQQRTELKVIPFVLSSSDERDQVLSQMKRNPEVRHDKWIAEGWEEKDHKCEKADDPVAKRIASDILGR